VPTRAVQLSIPGEACSCRSTFSIDDIQLKVWFPSFAGGSLPGTGESELRLDAVGLRVGGAAKGLDILPCFGA